MTVYGCVISVCSIGYTSLDVVYDEMYDCVWIFVRSSFVISMCICVECLKLAHIACYSVCSHMGCHLVEPLCYGVI